MRVTGNGSNSRNSEVVVEGLLIAYFFSKWIDKTTKTAIAMTTDTPLLCQSSDFWSRIKISEWVVRATCN
jgi:hypothetical protein